jgi:thymidylate synthase (FAD)
MKLMKADLIDIMGDDIRVANAARVSFDKETDWLDLGGSEGTSGHSLSSRDIKLLAYLAREHHWTPFSHVMVTMRETVPIFVARQRFKHMVGFTYNEVSRRYVDDTPEFYTPDVWRGRAENKKQGSSDEVVEWTNIYDEGDYPLSTAYKDAIYTCVKLYEDMISSGVAPEQARMVLPQSMMTSYYVTGSLAAWARAYKLRIDSHSQKEIQDLAKQWGEILGSIPEIKYSWEALTKH